MMNLPSFFNLYRAGTYIPFNLLTFSKNNSLKEISSLVLSNNDIISGNSTSPSPIAKRSINDLIGSGFKTEIPPAIINGVFSFRSCDNNGIFAKSKTANKLV